jgi:phage N-6-adenine-methyltransferase
MEQLAIHFDYAALDTETRMLVQQRTSEIKALMKRAAQDIIDIGQKLIEVKARLGHGNFGAWLSAEFDWHYTTAVNFMRVAETFKNRNFLDLHVAPSALYLLAAPSTPESARVEVLERAQDGERITYTDTREVVKRHTTMPTPNVSAPHRIEIIDIHPKQEAPSVSVTPMAVHYSSASDKHNTPPEIIERVLRLFGTIDLDPCSNSRTHPNVPASHYYTEDDDGLAQRWCARTVYMNPPYGRIIGAWVDKLCASYRNHDVEEAIALVPARTDTAWFQQFRDYDMCLIDGRLKFGEAENSAPFPSVVFYLGSNIDRFCDAFEHIGDVWTRRRR